MTPPAPQERTPFSFRAKLRVLLGVGVGMGSLLMLLFGGTIWALANLHQPTLKAQIQAALEEDLGLALDYSKLSIAPLSSLHLEELVIQTPSALRGHAPELLSLKEARISWDGWGLRNQRLHIPELSLRGLHLALVIDEDGQSSLSMLAEGLGPSELPTPPPSPSASEERAPLSRGFALPPLAVELELEKLHLQDLKVSVFQIEAGRLRRRIELQGLELLAHAKLGAEGPRLRMDLRSPPEGADFRLQLTDYVEDKAHERFLVASFGQLVQILDSTHLEASLNVELKDQSFDPNLARSGALATLETQVEFRPQDGLTHIKVPKLSLLGEAVQGTWSLDLRDGPGSLPSPVLREAKLHVAVDPILAFYPVALPGLQFEDLALDLGAKELAVDTESWFPTAGTWTAAANVGTARWQQAGQEAKLKKGRFTLDGQLLGPLRFNLNGGFDAQQVAYTDGKTQTRIQGLRTGLHGTAVSIDAAVPMRSTGQFRLEGGMEGLDARTASGHIQGRGCSFTGSTAVTGAPPYAFQSRLELKAFSLRSPWGENAFDEAALELLISAKEVVPDLDHPQRSRGQLSSSLGLAPFNLKLEATKETEAGSWQLSGSAAQLRPVAALLPPEVRRLNRVDWGRLGLSFRSDGRFSGPLRPQALKVTHQSSLAVTGLSLRRPGLNLATRRISMALDSSGSQRTHQGALELRVDAPRLNAFSSEQQHSFSAKLDFDLPRHRLALDASTRAPLGPDVAFKLSGHFDRQRKSLRYDADMSLARLQHLAAFIPPALRKQHVLDWEKLRIDAKAAGDLGGSIQRFTPQGAPILATDPLGALRGEQRFEMALTGLDYAGDALTVQLSESRFESTLKGSDTGLKSDSKLKLASLDLRAAGQRMLLKDWDQSLDLTIDDPRQPKNVVLGAVTRIAQLEQSVSPIYPLGDLKLVAGLKIQDGQELELSHMAYENGAGVTRLKLNGSALLEAPLAGREAAPDEEQLRSSNPTGLKRIRLEGELVQQLAPLSGAPQRFLGRGSLGIPFSIESANGRRFRAIASAQAQDVHISMPTQQASLNGMNGKLSFLQEFEITPDGKVEILAGASRNAYSRLSYQDVHPFLSGDSYLSIDQVESKGVVAGPIAGNLRIDRNIIGLEQLQMSFLGGTITGNMMADTRPGDREIRFRGNITGLRPSKTDDRLDANAAIVFRPETLELEGRSQILRIGRQHLVDMLDLFDPYREDKNMNATRQALLAGYPKRVRLRFKHGFTAMKIELGGLAGVAEISEIRGIPLGPLMQRYVGPYLPSDEDS